MTDEKMIELAINTIRTLSIDAVQQASSGHPGTPMALAPLVYTIWNRVMRFARLCKNPSVYSGYSWVSDHTSAKSVS
jgi:transketolase